jgi:hypothetical protein
MGSELSPRSSFAVGLLFIVCGLWPILVGFGWIHAPAAEPTPGWVPVCAGLVFVMGGIAVILDFAIAGGVGPDGDFRPGTSTSVRVGNFMLGMTIVGLITAVFGWVAFGSGTRHFSSTVSLPFIAGRWASGELSGRVAFGAATVLMAAAFIACGLAGIDRLRRSRRG